MGRDFFQILPSELTSNILSRLPFRSVAISKCVCKSWLNLLDSDYFKIKPPPALVCLKGNASRCTIIEIEDKDEVDLESHDLHYIPLTDFDIPHRSSRTMRFTAADGLLLLHSYIDDPETLHICNPLTREYIVLCCPKQCTLFDYMVAFCVSKISGQYKVVCLCRTPSEYDYFQLCGFDVETECFSIFSPPPALALALLADGDEEFYFELTVFRDCLCICYIQDNEIIIWLMKEYRVEESWTIEYKLNTIGFEFDPQVENFVYPIKVFKDGDILMLLNGDRFIFYSNKTKTIQHVASIYSPWRVLAGFIGSSIEWKWHQAAMAVLALMVVVVVCL
ncbi:uncharacterized protein LOC121778883 [Salvia splendens]|uniref:uncharacterized protein LOC121778883 n=1 Tax=Salvia splendens TaxID=180675 RepID=UPI001C266CB4|nr:uncharacterized protein LOC121778883 [Salvia splendens]